MEEDTATIVEAALATSAATSFFEPVTIGNYKYVDGALGANNPVYHINREASKVWDSEGSAMHKIMKCFISIGTGNPGMRSIEESAYGFLANTLKEMATETEPTAEGFTYAISRCLSLIRVFPSLLFLRQTGS